MRLDQVKAIITGGASGLGFAVAQHLVAAGARVSLFDVNDEKGLASASALGASARFSRVDVTDESAMTDAVSSSVDAMGGLNVAISCAGVLGAGRVLGKEGPMPLSQFETTVRINLVGSFNLAKSAAAQMQGNDAGEDGERGVIINTASIAAFEGQIGQAAYAASKGGVVGMTLPMAREFARIGVRVMTVAPGIFHTPMVDGMPPAVYESLCAQVPYPSRLGQPGEFAETCAFILQNRYLNGSVIRVDGAVRLAPK
jgi:NAD(P)-dependent dehydrogenase (short-subunit alcohol dehydrogenase family)